MSREDKYSERKVSVSTVTAKLKLGCEMHCISSFFFTHLKNKIRKKKKKKRVKGNGWISFSGVKKSGKGLKEIQTMR